jgi:hypothetical protein
MRKAAAMTDEQKSLVDVLMKMYQEHSTQCRHHELQRSTIVTAVIAVAGVVVGLVTYDQAITRSDLPLTAFLIALGVFGAAFALKQYERFEFHMERARQHRTALDNLLGSLIGSRPPLQPLNDAATRIVESKYPTLFRLRLHRWWFAFGLIAALLGVVLSAIAALSRQLPPCS